MSWLSQKISKHLFKSCRSDKDPATESSLPQSVGKALGHLLESLGALSLPVESEDPESVQEKYDAWAEHVRDGNTSPGSGFKIPLPFKDRIDWNGLKKFVIRQRTGEKKFYIGNLKDLRKALWGFVSKLSRDINLENDFDKEMGNQLHRIREATRTEDVNELREEVLGAVESLSIVIDKRQDLQRDRLKHLGAQMRLMRKELADARHQLNLDPMTRLFNRSSFDETLSKVVSLSSVMGDPATLVMIDLDYFKSINDQFGHQAGDEVLLRVADLLVKTFPRKTDFVARYGGEELAVILQQDSEDVAKKLCDRFVKKLREEKIQFKGKQIQVTASLGVAELRFRESEDEWLSRADQALYVAKEEGRDRIIYADHEPVSA